MMQSKTVIVKNNSGSFTDEPRFSYPLTISNVPDGEYQGILIDQYRKENKMGGYYWLDGISMDDVNREAINITNYHQVVKQPFEKHIKLAKHIQRMANTGNTGSTFEWSDFIRELNKAVI